MNQLLGGIRKVPLRSIVHFGGIGGSNSGFDNAFWAPSEGVMVYGDGRLFNSLVSEPTVGLHEISHMCTQQLAGTLLNNGLATGLDYKGDSGGLNESNSDQGAIAAMQRLHGDLIPIDNKIFRIGIGLFRDDDPDFALRDMTNPGAGYKDAKYMGTDPQAPFANYDNWRHISDQVDPHLASAVGNKWYRNAALNLYNHNFGATWQTIEQIRMRALPLCKQNITYPEYAAITIKVAKELNSTSDSYYQAVLNAWKDVHVI